MGLDHKTMNGFYSFSLYVIMIMFVLMEMIGIYHTFIYADLERSSLVFILDLVWDIYNLCLDVNIILVYYIYNSIP